MMRSTLLIVFSLILAACGGEKSDTASTSEQDSLTKEEAVSQATFTDLEGNTVAVSDFDGKVVLIDFWETWCTPCLASFKTLQQLKEDYPDRFVVLAVTPGFTDTKEDAREFAANHDYDFEFLFDENKLHQKLNVQGIPYKVYVGPGGNYLKESLGSSGPEGDYRVAKEVIEEQFSQS